jgi:hypothetical protein
MFSLEATLLRHFFETHGFLVRQCLPSGANATESLQVINPSAAANRDIPPILFASGLDVLSRGLVWLPGWSALKISPSQLKSQAELTRFIDRRLAERKVPAEFDETNAARIVVVPSVPTEEPYRTEVIELLKVRKIDAMLSLRSVLLDLIAHLDVRQPREGLQLLQILDNFDLLKKAQMELFQDERKR